MGKLEELKIVEKYPELKENIEVLNLVLLDLQRWLLREIISTKRPTTTRFFFARIMKTLFASSGFGKDSRETKLLISEDTPIIPDKVIDEFTKKHRDAVANGESSTNIVEDIIKPLFNKYRIPYPSYHKIENDLSTLMDWGILSKYKSGNKTYWILNPRFYLIFKKDLLKI